MPENKTKASSASVDDFLSSVDDENRREDTRNIMSMMQQITGHEPKMWGTSIIGFDSYRYVYKSGHSGEWPIVGVSPRKRNISIYIMPGFSEYDALISKLGKHKTGKSCLYINRLNDVDNDVLYKLIERSVVDMREKYAVQADA